MPLVTVLLPAYNAAHYVLESIRSILSQTLQDFELLVIDDGSDDETEERILKLKDPRVRCERNGQNQGLVRTLNLGLSLARGKYIARMDADDVAHPRRLELQAGFLERHPDYVACGTWMRLLGERTLIRHEHKADRLRARLLFNTQLAHPTVMIRSETLSESGLRYDERYRIGEDYDLWIKVAKLGNMTNLRVPLVEYRHHSESLSAKYASVMDSTLAQLRRKALRLLSIEPTDSEMAAHRCLADGAPVEPAVTHEHLRAWCRKLEEANRATGYTTTGAMASVLRERLWKIESRKGAIPFLRHQALRIRQVYLSRR